MLEIGDSNLQTKFGVLFPFNMFVWSVVGWVGWVGWCGMCFFLVCGFGAGGFATC